MAPQSFKYVYIPADLNEPIQECNLAIPEGKDVECLLDHLKLHFTSDNVTAAQKAARKQALLDQLGDKAAGVDERMLEMAANMQMVENIALLTNHKDVGYVGVNMYTDDHAQAKELPFNHRATSIADACGKMIQVRGDAFVARIFDDDDKFERMDFSLAELSSSAGWVQQAKQQAAKRAQAEDMQVMLNAAQAKAKAAAQQQQQPKSEAEQAKDAGNACVKQGDWAGAAQHYTRALELQPDMLAAVGNRALANLKLGKLEEAIQDCDQVLSKEPDHVKVLLRRAAAREAQGQAELAVQDYFQVLRVQPVNKEAAAALDRLKPPAPPTDSNGQ